MARIKWCALADEFGTPLRENPARLVKTEPVQTELKKSGSEQAAITACGIPPYNSSAAPRFASGPGCGNAYRLLRRFIVAAFEMLQYLLNMLFH